MKTMRALEVGDRVKTKAIKDYDGNERFPVGTIAIVTQIDCTQKYSIRVSTNDDWWWYSADEIELVQELSAAEVPAILYEICKEYSKGGVNCNPDCPFAFHGMGCDQYRAENGQRVAEICERWKADHEKKEPEFEWVDVCRIIEVQDNGKKVCVHEEDLKDADLPFGYKECTAELILKEYMKSHDGNYFATVERVYRVKGEK